MKALKLSDELASAVLGKEVTKCSLINKTRNSINITYFEDKEDFNTVWKEWNIYELAFKCKEWAYTNKYRLSSGQHRLNTKQEHYINNQIASYFCSVYYITNDDSDIQIDANTEPEAIFKACEWLLEMLNEKA